MKTKKFILGMAVALSIIFTLPSDLGATPPPWAPANGYRAKTRHIYFPQQRVFFDLQRGVYMYPNNGTWISTPQLPAILNGINLRTVHQVQIPLNVDDPYKYRTEYPYSLRPEYGKIDKQTKKIYKEQRKQQREYDKAVRKNFKHNKGMKNKWMKKNKKYDD